MKISFFPPYIDDLIINDVMDTLKSDLKTKCLQVKALEAEIKSFTSAKEVLCLNS